MQSLAVIHIQRLMVLSRLEEFEDHETTTYTLAVNLNGRSVRILPEIGPNVCGPAQSE
jgi:hypothetical protein